MNELDETDRLLVAALRADARKSLVELARDDLRNAERVLQQATSMLSQFNAVHPYRMVSIAVH